MDRKRAPLLLLALALVGAVAVLFLLVKPPSGRADRAATPRSGALDRSDLGRTDEAASRVADALRREMLIRKYGGFTSKGRVLLTLPRAPGADLEVALRGSIDGWTVEGRAHTDKTGRFRMGALPRLGNYLLTVQGPRVQPLREAVAIDPGTERDFGDLVLARYYFVQGTVTGEGGMRVKGAKVALVASANNRDFNFLQSANEAGQDEPVLATAETEPDGRYSLRLTEPGMFSLRARAEGFATHYEADVVVDARALADHDLALTRGLEIAGYVFDGADRPVPEATVAIYAMRGFGFGAAKELDRTDSAGRFDFRVEPYNARYMVRAIPPVGIDLVKIVDLPLSADLILRMPGSGTLKGRVISAETQQPISGADVLIGLADRDTRAWMPDYSKPVKTDEYGVFRFESVGAGFLQSLSIRKQGYAQVMLSRMFPSDRALWDRLTGVRLSGDAEVALPDIPLARGRLLRGTVTEKKSGKPIEGARVELRDFVMGNRSIQTDANGIYRFDAVGARVSMLVSAPGYASFQDTPFLGSGLPAGESETVRDIQLQSGGTLNGTVRAPDGSPLPGALVRLDIAESGRAAWTGRILLRSFYAYSDEQGGYAFAGVPPFRLRATAELSGFDRGQSKVKQIGPGELVEHLDIVLVNAARAAGKVVSREGDPVAGARVTFTRDPGQDADATAQWRALARGVSTFTGQHGNFSIEDVPTGDILIRIEAQEFATTSVRRPGVRPGAVLKGMRIELPPSFVITGRVVGPDGKPVSNCWVRASHTASPDGEATSQLLGARVESDGTFAVRSLPAGSYTIDVRLPRGIPGQPQFKNLSRTDVAAGSKDLVLALELTDG